jgi:HK97 family phage portal protein
VPDVVSPAGAVELRSLVTGEELWMPAPSLAGVPVGPGTVTAFGAYYAGVYVISSDLASVPFVVTKKSPGGVRQIDDSFWLHDCVFHSPDGEMSAMGYIQAVGWHCLTRGNSFARILYDDSRMFRPVGFRLGDQGKWLARRTTDKARTVYYTYDGEPIHPKEVLHIAGVGGDGIIGVSPITHARELLGLAMATEKTAAAWYGNGIHPGGVLEIPEKFDEIKLQKYRAAIENVHVGPFNAYKHMILWNGAKFTPTTISAVDADFIAGRQMSIEDIARILNLAPSKLQKWDKVSFSTLEEVNTNHYDSCIYPWVRRITTEMNRKLLTRAERKTWEVVHDISQGRRGRLLDEANRDKIWQGMGVINANEIRARNGMAPIPGGDAYFIPLNTAPMDKIAGASISEIKGVKPAKQEAVGALTGEDLNVDLEGDSGDVPAAPAPAEAVASGDASVQDTAMNGAQIESLLGVVEQVGTGAIPAASAKAILGAAFPMLTPESIDAMLDPLASVKPAAAPAASTSTNGNGNPEAAGGDLAGPIRDLVADVARRAATRLAGAARRAVKRGDLSAVLPALDAMFTTEPATLAAMFMPAARIAGAAARRPIDPAAVVGRITDRCRADILACVEGVDTVGNLGRAFDAWESAIPDLALQAFSHEDIIHE